MAQGFLQSFDKNIEVSSAGTMPALTINQKAVEVMREAGIDISHHYPKPADHFVNDEWDYVITVCDQAKETCPVFFGKVKHRLHISFEDPSLASGTPEFIDSEYRRVRDEIREAFKKLYNENLKHEL
jgi:arsenate reductase (thioredoxin)